MGTISFFCLMPIGKFDSVFSKWLKPKIEALSDELNITIRVKRADLEGPREEEIMKRIINGIHESDIMIIDITQLNPNVMWELGYCKALGKTNIILTQDDYKDIPFNIRQDLIYRYKYSANGSRIFNAEFDSIEELAKRKIELLEKKASYLRDAKQFNLLINQVYEGARNIHVNSILGTSINLKLRALVDEVRQIDQWRYGIYHPRAKEGIKYLFSKVFETLGPGDIYLTISFTEFWKEVSDDNNDSTFLKQNAEAAEVGAQIKRLIVIDSSKYKKSDIKKDRLLNDVLNNHKTLCQQFPDNFSCKVLFADISKKYVSKFQNFALIKRKDEEAVLVTHRNSQTGQLETEMIFLGKDEVNHVAYEKHETQVNKYKERFYNHWESGDCEILDDIATS